MPSLTQKGQVTVPLPIRKKLNLRTGDDVLFVEKGREVVLRKRTYGKAAFQKYKGFLKHLKETEPDEIVERLRGKTDDFSR